MVLPEVTVETFGKAPSRPLATQISAFAGKEYCFPQYLKGLRKTPTHRMVGVWYDNSTDPKMHKRLLAIGQELFPKFTLITDDTPPRTAETTEDYQSISTRVNQIYLICAKHLHPKAPYVFIVEDDVGIPDNTFDTLKETVESHPKIVTAVGNLYGRRLKDRAFGIPCIWNFDVASTIPPNGTEVKCRRFLKDKAFGTELIGSAHMGAWLSKTPFVRRLGFDMYPGGVAGVQATDVCWGFKLWQMGYWMAVNWAVPCKHYYRLDGELGVIDPRQLTVKAIKGPYMHPSRIK